MAYFVREVGLVKSDFWSPEIVRDLHKFEKKEEAKDYLSKSGYKEQWSKKKGAVFTKSEDDYDTYTMYRAKIIEGSNIYDVVKVDLLDKWLLSTIR